MRPCPLSCSSLCAGADTTIGILLDCAGLLILNDMDNYFGEMFLNLRNRDEEQNDLFASIADVQVTTLNELDTLLAQGNKREIMKNRGRFIAAVQNDQKRTQQLESILNDVLLLEQEIAIIKGLNDNDNPWGAWEIARTAQEKFSDDNELLKLSVELGEKVSPFVRVIKRAEKLEDEKHNGMSLTWYLKAKSIYPKSNYAKDGMNRLLNIILPADIEENNDEAAIENQPEKLEF